jgi:5-formyltetrahydrofolate cyclo-ligase
MEEQKSKLRKQMYARRDALDLGDIMEKSEVIKGKLFTLKEIQDANTIMFYSSCRSEVRTREMIEEALAMGKDVVLPITNIKKKTATLVKINSTAALIPNEAGIPEPKPDNKEHVKPEELDLIIAPGVAFTEDGKRLGQGWGFFDQLFTKTKAKRIGLCFDMQLMESVPTEAHDQDLDLLVTESGVFRPKLI